MTVSCQGDVSRVVLFAPNGITLPLSTMDDSKLLRRWNCPRQLTLPTSIRKECERRLYAQIRVEELVKLVLNAE